MDCSKSKVKIDNQNVSSPNIDFNEVSTINLSSKIYLKRKAHFSRVIAASVVIDIPSHAIDFLSIQHSDNKDEKTNKPIQAV